MSVGLLIKEGQVGRKILPVEKLKINNIGGGESYWVPEETTEVDSLDVSKNGLYYAINDDLDGYDQVNVNVPPDMDENDIAKGKKITGTGDDGNDYAYGLDENDDGDKVITVEQIPAAIHIVVPPRKLKYEDGETIDFTGIHVYLMNGNNQRYTDEDYPTGEIPFDELVFPVIYADSSGSSAQYPEYQDSGTVVVTSVGSISAIIDDAMSKRASGWEDPSGYINQIKSEFSVYDGVNPAIVSASTYEGRFEGWAPVTVQVYPEIKVGDTITIGNNNLTKRYRLRGTADAGEPIVLDDIKYDTANTSIWLGFRSDSSTYYASSINAIFTDTQEIPVQWIRPEDGKVLEDVFTIKVGGGEPAPSPPDPWGGYADVSYNGHHYNLNRRIVPEIHYANGYLWQEGTSEYTVDQAIDMGWLILIR